MPDRRASTGAAQSSSRRRNPAHEPSRPHRSRSGTAKGTAGAGCEKAGIQDIEESAQQEEAPPENLRQPPAAASEKKVVRNGGTADPVVQLAPGMSAEQASSQRQSTTQLLAATDDNLKQIASRQLNSTQQDSVSQIRKYMEQAKAAEEAGDVQRAHNLASKALLLSDDLVKHWETLRESLLASGF